MFAATEGEESSSSRRWRLRLFAGEGLFISGRRRMVGSCGPLKWDIGTMGAMAGGILWGIGWLMLGGGGGMVLEGYAAGEGTGGEL